MKDTRDRIVSAAYGCFLEKGYEQTSVRMILEKAGVTTGSFYHFFPSKEKLFEAAVDAFLTDYVSAFASICHNRDLPVTQRCGLLFEELAKRMGEYYGKLGGDHLHWSIMYSLHEKTMASLLPSVEALLTDAIQAGAVKSRMEIDTRTLSTLLLRGVETILHSRSDFQTEAERTACCLPKCGEYLNLLLEILPLENGQMSVPGVWRNDSQTVTSC